MPPSSDSPPTFRINTERGLYPIVYVRGFAATIDAREETFYDTYYGYAETAVEKRDAPPPRYLEPIVFEGQLIRFLKEYGYVDAANGGLKLALRNTVRDIDAPRENPTRSLWISRFYDPDFLAGQVRRIEDHAEDLRRFICEEIPAQLKQLREVNVNLGQNDEDYRVILIAHSMGGLICRCLIQNLLPDPKRWIHRLVTIGTPHGGIELSAVPDFLEELAISEGNVLNAAIFKQDRMRQYLKLNEKDENGKLPDLHSLNGKYPAGRCLCIVGSDHESYTEVKSLAKKVTGSYSDGLVKQDRAYIKGAYRANVHRAHSGRRGLVNSFETYENIRRFLFGDTRVKLWLENVALQLAAPPGNIKEFYDLEFALSVSGTGVFLHQRRQKPCENAKRFHREEFPLARVHLHTGFMDSTLRPAGVGFSRFLLAFRVAQHRVEDGFLFDHQYPERTIYSETMEIGVDVDIPLSDEAGATPVTTVKYRWLSDTINLDDKESWQPVVLNAGLFRFPFRQANTLTGELCVQPGRWPDDLTPETVEDIDAAQA